MLEYTAEALTGRENRGARQPRTRKNYGTGDREGIGHTHLLRSSCLGRYEYRRIWTSYLFISYRMDHGPYMGVAASR